MQYIEYQLCYQFVILLSQYDEIGTNRLITSSFQHKITFYGRY